MERFLWGGQIGLALWGLLTLFQRVHFRFGRPPLRGVRAKLIGVLGLMPLPTAYLVGYLCGCLASLGGWQLSMDALRTLGLVIDGAVILLFFVAYYVVAYLWPEREDTTAERPTAEGTSDLPCDSDNGEGIKG